MVQGGRDCIVLQGRLLEDSGHRIAGVRFTSSKEPLVQDWGWTVGFTVRIRE